MENIITTYTEGETYDTSPPTMIALPEVIKKLKRREAPGPDGIPTEIIKELSEENLQHVLDTVTSWWTNEDISEEELTARVVLIYKKGDTNKFDNYTPISLLSTLYKLFASILHRRISATLDKHPQTTQYGFREDKSTADAIHLIRRLIEYGESSKN